LEDFSGFSDVFGKNSALFEALHKLPTEYLATLFFVSLLCVVKLFFLNFFPNSQFDISKMDKNKCPKWENEIENYKKSLEKQILLHRFQIRY